MYCIIVGDIINSREIDIDIREEVTTAAKNILNRINTENIDFLMANFGLVRGDAFEGVLLSPYNTAGIIQDIIKALYGVHQTKVRISVVLGQLTQTGSDRNETDGPAFHKAFENLAKMKARKSTHWLQVSYDTNTYVQPLVDSMLNLLSSITAGWTDRQREIVWAMEELSLQQNKVSEKLGISASVVNKQLKAANFEVYHQAWINLERFLTDMEETAVYQKSILDNSYTIYYSVGQRKKIQKKYDEAYALLLKALEVAKGCLNENDPILAILYNGLAETLTKLGKFSEAKKYIAESLRLQKALPRARLEYANTLNIMGSLYLNSEDRKAAERYYKEAREIALDAVGEMHPFTNLCDNILQSVTI